MRYSFSDVFNNGATTGMPTRLLIVMFELHTGHGQRRCRLAVNKSDNTNDNRRRRSIVLMERLRISNEESDMYKAS